MADDTRDSSRTSTALTPGALDRGALERVLARAAELNAGVLEPSEGMSETQLVELGKEVGISAEHIRQALAEERTRVTLPEAAGFMGMLYGGTSAQASRIVQGTPATVLAQLDQWMQREEMLRPKRRFADRLTWEGRRDFVGSLQVGLNFSGRPYALNGASDVGATVVAVDAQRSLVRLDADFGDSRRRTAWWSGSFGALGLAGGGGLVAVAASIPGASAMVAGLVGGAIGLAGTSVTVIAGRVHAKRVIRAQLALEQVLDRLEHNDMPKRTNPLNEILNTLTR